jgi:hypothetical protein
VFRWDTMVGAFTVSRFVRLACGAAASAVIFMGNGTA